MGTGVGSVAGAACCAGVVRGNGVGMSTSGFTTGIGLGCFFGAVNEIGAGLAVRTVATIFFGVVVAVLWIATEGCTGGAV